MQEAMWERQHELVTDKIYARYMKLFLLISIGYLFLWSLFYFSFW